MSFQTGTATDYSDLLDKLDTFLTSQGMTLAPIYAGTGNGTIAGLIGGSASVAEIITITFTDATHFDVAGSISGAIASGTVGVAFVSTKINFTITAGGTAFVAGDVFTVSTTPKWTSNRRTSGDQMIWTAPGDGGTDHIIVGAKLFHDAGADYYNWQLGGFTAFDSGFTFENQANYVGGIGGISPAPVLNLWNSSIPYWFVGSGRRVIVVAKISSVYTVAYLGFTNSYVSPGAFPYPLVIAGSLAWDDAFITGQPALNSVFWRWSFTGSEIRNLGIGEGSRSNDAGCQLRLRLPNGNWMGFGSNWSDQVRGRIWPYTDAVQGGMSDWRDNLDGGYTILPVVLHDFLNVYGELDGIGAITGFSQSAENTITIGLSKWLVVPNVFRATKTDYFAVKLI